MVHLCAQGRGCTVCHSAPGIPSSPRLAFGLAGTPPRALPATYTPETTYQMLIRIIEDNPARCVDPDVGPCGLPAGSCGFGFQIAAVLQPCGSTLEQAGCFTPGAGMAIECDGGNGPGCPSGCSGPTALQYLEQDCGIEPDAGTTDTKTWVFDWTAPAAMAPPRPARVCFYLAVNSVDGNYSSRGDAPIYWDDPVVAGINFCWDEAAPPPGCDLLTDAVTSLAPPVDLTRLFPDAVSCPPDRIPSTLKVGSFTALSPPVMDVDPFDSGNPSALPLAVYQVRCGPSCAGTLHLDKNRATGQVRATFVP
jgi:hypothetical protein